jgi:isocitrate lyase
MENFGRVRNLERDWKENERWLNVRRDYSAEDVIRLSGSMDEEYTMSTLGSKKLWNLINEDGYVNSMGAVTAGQAMQQVKAGIKVIYLSGWQVSADGNSSETMYPDQSLYAYNSVPITIKRINNTFRRADEIQWAKGSRDIDYFVPIIADAEAGFGGVLNSFELTKSMIENGVSGIHLEDQLSSAKKCGHMGGKVLVPTQEAIQKLISARLASDVMGVPIVIIARTDANAATLLTSDIDVRDKQFVTGERTEEGFFKVNCGIDQAISRGLAYAPYADMLWCETAVPNLEEAQKFATAIHQQYPGKLLAYNCSPSFNWKKNLDDKTIAEYQQKLGEMGFKWQFITLAGIHDMWHSMFELSKDYVERGMTAYVEGVQEPEFASVKDGYTFARHQEEVGAGYFDSVTNVIQGGNSSVTAMDGSTEEEQF